MGGVPGTRGNPWVLKTPGGAAEYAAWRDPAHAPPAIVVRAGGGEIRYHLRCLNDLDEMLKARRDWMPLGGAGEKEPAADGSVEAWARSAGESRGRLVWPDTWIPGLVRPVHSAHHAGAHPCRDRRDGVENENNLIHQPSWTPDSGILLGYFAKPAEAVDALGKLKRRGFHRIAVLSRTSGGDVHTRDLFLRNRRITALAAALACGLLCAGASVIMGWSMPGLGAFGTPAAGTAAGLLLGWVSRRRSRLGVGKKVLQESARWLVSDETAIIIQAKVDSLQRAVSVLRAGGDTPPAVFILQARAESAPPEVRKPGVPLSPEQIREHAARLAVEHRIQSRQGKAAELLARIHSTRRRIRGVCAELSQAARLEQGTPPTAEWILDNEYVIESNTRDVLVNLPPRFYRELPTLAGGRSAGLPRIYELARELIADLELRLDRESVLSFIDAYQSSRPLAIGELWALPQMLRVALIESVCNLALRAAVELRERESADFWANRLIRANRRGSDQLFALLAELAVQFPGPSSYFSSQLIGHLYDEETVLVLVQGWLERTSHLPVSELSLREQNRQAKDQISIGNAFTSLRQLALLDWRQIFENLSRVEQLLRGDPSGIYPGNGL